MDQVVVNQSALDAVLHDRYDTATPTWRERPPDYPSNLSTSELLREVRKRFPDSIQLKSLENLARQAIGTHSNNIGIRYDNIWIHSRHEVILRKSSGLFKLFPQIVLEKSMDCTFAYYNNNGEILYSKKRVTFIDESYDPEEPQIFVPRLNGSHFDSPVILTEISPVISEWVNEEHFDIYIPDFSKSSGTEWIRYSDLITEIRLAEELSKTKTLSRLLSKKIRGISENAEGIIKLTDAIDGNCNGLWLEGDVLEYEPNLMVNSLSNNYPRLIFPSSSLISALFILNQAGAHQVYQELNEKEKVCIPFPIRNPGGEIEICNIILLKDYKLGKIYHNLKHFPEAGVLLSTQF